MMVRAWILINVALLVGVSACHGDMLTVERFAWFVMGFSWTLLVLISGGIIGIFFGYD